METRSVIDSRRVVIVHWKDNKTHPFDVYSSLKNFCIAHPRFAYDTLSNYLSKKKVAFENEQVRIERKEILTLPVKPVRPDLPKRLFWEFKYDSMDWVGDADIVIERVIERGSEKEWDAMISFYGMKKAKFIVKNKIGFLTDKAIKKACDYFNLKPEDLKCYTRKQSRTQHWN